MAIKLAAFVFSYPVIFTVPGDNGEPIEIKFNARLRRLSKTKRLEADKRLRKASCLQLVGIVTNGELRKSYVEQLEELKDIEPLDNEGFAKLVLAGWDLKDTDGADVPSDEATLTTAFDQWEGLALAIAQAYGDACNPKASAKNSEKPSPTTSGQTAQMTE